MPKAVRENLGIAAAYVAFFAAFAAIAVFVCGCTTGEYTGSRTIVGEQDSLPELSDSGDTVTVKVYESVKGAKVWTAKDCNVKIAYTNAYTNTYFGVLDRRNYMTLAVEIEPCEVSPTGSASEAEDAPTDEAK